MTDAKMMLELADKLESRLFKDRRGNIDAELGIFISGSLSWEVFEAVKALRAPAARTQEPVAWRTPMVSKDHYQLTSYADVAEQWRRNGASVEPLYATPQPPAAQGEVERRRNQLAEVKRLVEALPCECDGYHRYECGKHAIERALEAASPDHAQGARQPCGCGVMCQDLGKEAGCRYMQPARRDLRKLVDLVYKHAADSVPMTLTADRLIDEVFGPAAPSELTEGSRGTVDLDADMAEHGFYRDALIEECAKIAENCFGGKAHTYASENADLYRSQDAACELIAAKIRALSLSSTERS